MTIRSSIIWNPAGTVVPVGGANLVTSIVGPMAISGSSHADPMFVDETNHDYHLAPGSPAIDQATTGPATDLDGTPRPQGARFDLGAYEAK